MEPGTPAHIPHSRESVKFACAAGAAPVTGQAVADVTGEGRRTKGTGAGYPKKPAPVTENSILSL